MLVVEDEHPHIAMDELRTEGHQAFDRWPQPRNLQKLPADDFSTENGVPRSV